MGLLDRLRTAISGPPLSEELATLAGQCEALVNRLRRHAERPLYPAIANGVREIAKREAEHDRILRRILAERGLWPRPPEELPQDGSSNWQRLNGDLLMLQLFSQELNRHAVKWQAEDLQMSEMLRTIASEASDSEFELRKLTAKLDPQAID